MSPYLYLLAGEVALFLVLDIVLTLRIRHEFPRAKRLWWPGAGLWTCWKLIAMYRMARNRLCAIHAAAMKFPLGSHHSTITREFVEVIGKYSRSGGES